MKSSQNLKKEIKDHKYKIETNFLDADEEEFSTSCCCGKAKKGVTYETHEKNQPFC